ncbi:MAG: DinB family protein [Candidatus Eisenbacteria bacterium]|nr:DinB family protein [Candidatus Eisenbacteria bacterium]
MLVFSDPERGGHTLWTLGHLAYIESLIIRSFMLGQANPLAHWEEMFDGPDTSGDPSRFPPFEEVLAMCRKVREETIAILATLSEGDLDLPGARTPAGFESTFGTYRDCLQFVADHWYMHRGTWQMRAAPPDQSSWVKHPDDRGGCG